MCAQLPGQIVDVAADSATVVTGSRSRRASTLLFDDLRVGDWVLVAAGTVVRRLSAEDARQLTNDFAQLMGDLA